MTATYGGAVGSDGLERPELRKAGGGLVYSRAAFNIAKHMLDHQADVISGTKNLVPGYTYPGLGMASLPHRRLPDGASWQLKSDQVTLIMEPGSKPGPGDTAISVGLPYGSRARLILLFMQTTALRTKSLDIHFGRSLREFLTALGVPPGETPNRLVLDQLERLIRCRISFHVAARDRITFLNDDFVQSGGRGKDGYHARLSDRFFHELMTGDALPVDMEAIRQLHSRSAALDLYTWLVGTLPSLDKPMLITWPAIKAQFGRGFNVGVGGEERLWRNFQRSFRATLDMALAAYIEAEVKADDHGVTLLPSPAPVPCAP